MKRQSASTVSRTWAALGRSLVCTIAIGLGLAVYGAAAETPDKASARLLELERIGRAQPKEAVSAAARMVANNEGDADTQIKALILQGRLLAFIPSADEAEAVARELDRRFDASKNTLARAGALLVRAASTERSGNLARAGELIDEAIAAIPPNTSASTRSRFLSVQAKSRGQTGRFEEAIRIGHEVLTLADAEGIAWRRAQMRSDLAYMYFQAQQNARALSLNEEALAIAQADGDALVLSYLATVQGIVLEGTGDIQGEKRWLLAAIDYARAAGSKYDEAQALANIADFYLKNGEYATALQRAQEALPLTREQKNPDAEVIALANIGLSQIRLGQIEAGKRNLRLGIDINERRGALSGMADLYKEMGEGLESVGDLQGAVEAFHQQRNFDDQVRQRSQQKAILAMQEAFDNARRTSELELLKRQSAIQGEQIHSRKLQQGLWGLAVACGLLSLGVAALLVRRVRDTNRRLAASNAQLKAHAEVDPLTGLANRRHFQSVMRQLAADGKFSGTVFLADIDHFKRVNDCWGHASGDAVLVEIARRLRAVLREPDLIVRWGGEEFLIVVRASSPAAVEALAQRLLDVVGATPVGHDGRVIPVTASIGYATFPIEPTLLAVSWERAINLVDTALYLAKAHGRNRAYGVHMINANDTERFDAIARGLEGAWRLGDVALTLLEGPGSAAQIPAGAVPQAA